VAQLFSLGRLRTMTDSIRQFEFRGFAEVVSSHYRAHASWFGCGCVISSESITIRVSGYSHTHPKTELQELRWFWLPFPTLVVVSRIGAQYCLSSFLVLRGSRLRAAIQSCGYAFTEESRFCSFRRLRDDTRKYDLMEGISP